MPFRPGVRLTILDFDGVIVESNDIKDRVFQKIFSADVGRLTNID